MRRFFFLPFLFPLFLHAEPIGVSTLHFFDVRRTRPVSVEIWYPVQGEKGIVSSESPWILPEELRDVPIAASSSKRPLLLLSHGSRGDRKEHSWLAEKMVRQGFIVASVEHFGNTRECNHPVFFLKAWDRPKDISFVLDRLLSLSSFSSHIDKEKIIFSGYSLGGMTGVWMAGGKLMHLQEAVQMFSCKDLPQGVLERLRQRVDIKESMDSYKDARIKAFILLAPAAWGFSQESLQGIEAPILIVAPGEDEVLQVASHAGYLAKHIKNSEFLRLEGKAGHYIFLNECSDLGKQTLSEMIKETDRLVDKKSVHEETFQKIRQFLKNIFFP